MTNSTEPREAPLDSNMAVLYGYTLNVSPKKYILGKQYGNLSTEGQEEVLTSVMTNAVNHIGRAKCENEYKFELTKAGQTHLHGMIRCTAGEIHKLQYFVHSQLGMPKLDPSICFKYIKTIINPNVWLDYMNKAQLEDRNWIPEYNMFIGTHIESH